MEDRLAGRFTANWRLELRATEGREPGVNTTAQTMLGRWSKQQLVQDRPYFGLHRATVLRRTNAQPCTCLVIQPTNRQRRHHIHLPMLSSTAMLAPPARLMPLCARRTPGMSGYGCVAIGVAFVARRVGEVQWTPAMCRRRLTLLRLRP